MLEVGAMTCFQLSARFQHILPNQKVCTRNIKGINKVDGGLHVKLHF